MPEPGLVVVGASLAGLRTVEAARRSGYEGAITLIGAETHLPYDRPPLSKQFLDDPEPQDVTFRASLDDLGVRLLLGVPAQRLDPDERWVQVGGERVAYDAVVIATGSRARTLPGLGAIPGVHTLRFREDAVAIRAALERGARTVVVGAGFIGAEVASGARKRGLPVTVLEASPVPLVRAVGAEMGTALARLHSAHGTDLRCGVGVAAVTKDGASLTVTTNAGDELRADLVVLGVGAAPETDWLTGSGLALDDGVLCDASMAASVPGVYAAGDVARWHNPLFGHSMRLEHWTSAAEQAAVAGRNAVLGTAETCATVPYFWSDWYGVRIQFVGVSAADEVRVVEGSVDEGRFVAAYRTGDRLTGALCVGQPARIMKYRRQIADSATWGAALDRLGVGALSS